MLRALLAKDLRRAWRNPIPWLINLALPLVITALVGLVFGGKSDTELGRIRFAVVDEDDTMLTQMMRGAINQGEASKHLEPVFLQRADALRQVGDDKLSAALIIPTNFTRNYLTGKSGVTIELVKNPAQSINPTVLEELAALAVTALNGVSRNFQSEFPAWRAAFEDGVNYHKVADLMESAGHKVEAARHYLNPPLVIYETGKSETSGMASDKASGADKPAQLARPKKRDTMSEVFAFILPGMAGMFLLFLAGNAMSDLLRELRFRTFERYQTIREQLLPFILGKMLFAVVLVLLSSAILLGGGGLAFRVHWEHPGQLLALSLCYSCFAAALMAVFVALLPDERRAATLTNIAGMLLGIAGGCMFPPSGLPAFVRDHVTPLLPSAWFVTAARSLQFNWNISPVPALFKLLAVSAVLLICSVFIFQRRFRSGVRP